MTREWAISGFKGVIRTGSIVVTEQGVTLPNEPARSIKMENWDIKPDFALPADQQANAVDVLWGYGGAYIHWLKAGGNTEFLPITNLANINLRTKPGQQCEIFYSFLVEKS
ncbi:MAG: hypothetical protein ACR2GW_07065 [Pyrinomonadaceae bacterium]|jgi:hypothetical protein